MKLLLCRPVDALLNVAQIAMAVKPRTLIHPICWPILKRLCNNCKTNLAVCPMEDRLASYTRWFHKRPLTWLSDKLSHNVAQLPCGRSRFVQHCNYFSVQFDFISSLFQINTSGLSCIGRSEDDLSLLGMKTPYEALWRKSSLHDASSYSSLGTRYSRS